MNMYAQYSRLCVCVCERACERVVSVSMEVPSFACVCKCVCERMRM